MGRFKQWLEDTTSSAGAYANQLGHEPEENGLHRPQFLKPMTMKSKLADKVYGDLDKKFPSDVLANIIKKKRKSSKLRQLDPVS